MHTCAELNEHIQKLSIKEGDILLVNARCVNMRQITELSSETMLPPIPIVPVLPREGETVMDAFVRISRKHYRWWDWRPLARLSRLYRRDL